MRSLGISACLLLSSTATALDSIGLSIAKFEAEGLRLEGIAIRLSDLALPSQHIVLTVQSLELREPFAEITFAGIECSDFSWHDDEIHCLKGRAEIKAAGIQSPNFEFRFSIGPRRSDLSIVGLKAGGGEIAADASIEDERWSVRVKARGLQGNAFSQFIEADDVQIGEGRADVDFDAEGPGVELDRLSAWLKLNNISGQMSDGSIAFENIDAAGAFRANLASGNWQWLGRAELMKGAFYIEPWFVELPSEMITINGAGIWHAESQLLDIAHADFRHPGVFEASGSGLVQTMPSLNLEKGRIFINARDLKAFSEAYLITVLTSTQAEGLSLSGYLNADAVIKNNALFDVSADFSDLKLAGTKAELALEGGAGALYWTAREGPSKPSVFAWQSLQFANIPIGPSKVEFITEAASFRLLHKTRIPLLDGVLTIDRFDWTARENDDHDLFFFGGLEDLSLAKLSQALGWTPMSGTISGRIPGIDYRDNKLVLEGELTIDVFDGRITIGRLASTGLFSDFSQVFGSIEIDNLDLEQLTSKFRFGGIEGRLSGFVRDLYLENWKPVTFFAWLGTPDNDDSRRRISQTAVENLASIGGGGATDLISRTFLGFFETFGYESLGIGCYLKNGVCQLTGTKPAEHGYYIVKGGGLPRIDVMGYNPKVDWNVLLERLKRITTASDDIVIE